MKFTSILAMIGLSQCGPSDPTPPTTGKFFYTDLKNGNIDARVSNEEESFSLKLNTWTSGI